MLCIRADGHQIVRLAIIFGKNSGQHLSEEEKKCFHGLRHLIQVYFQDNAWADQHVMLHWLDQFSVDTAALNGEQVLLGMDNHGAQQTEAFKSKARAGNAFLAYTPPDCTDCVSPCDHRVGARLKNMMKAFYEEELENNLEEWTKGGLSASTRRIKMATWAAAAWALLRTEAGFLRSSFVSTGFLIAKDGSENNLIQIPSCPDYDFMPRG